MTGKNKGEIEKPEVTFVCGVELELEYDSDLLGGISLRSYHSNEASPFGNSFIAEEDGSLYPNTFRRGQTAEIISFPFEIDEWRRVLTDFKNEVEKRVAETNSFFPEGERKDFSKLELKDVLSFNNTTGAHLHVSFLKRSKNKAKKYSVTYKGRHFVYDAEPFPIKKVGTLRFLMSIVRSVLKRVEVELPNVYPFFRKRFFRDHSRRNRTFCNNEERSLCWNFQDEKVEHLEFRSFNLSGVETWADFFKMYEILFDELKKAFEKELSKREKFFERKRILLSDADFSEISVTDKIIVENVETKRSEKTIFLEG